MRRIALWPLPLLVAGCAANREVGDRRTVYLEDATYLWTDASTRRTLACGDGRPLVCSGAHGRLSRARCGCPRPAL